ncbi:MAG TPA: recombinase family protein [Symbiobacteriaceae bacterium]|nr:recombinase family protein [Symbiobacteriaceae bacterium]
MARRRKTAAEQQANAKKAVAYVRVSSEEQANEGVSLDAQEARVRAYCVANGLELVAIYRDEGVSAGIPLEKRQEGGLLLQALANGEAVQVVAVKLDRLFRNALDCLSNVERWDKAGIGLHLLDLSVNTSTAAGRAFLQMAAAFAEMERSLVKERTETALAHKKATLQAYNHTPYGFDRQGDTLVPKAAEQAVIERIKQMDSAGVPMLRIAETLNAEGVATKKGGKWYASTVKAILTNTIHGAVA